jgi:hypothetical protein
MPYYRIANLLIDSGIALPSVPPAPPRSGAWSFRLSRSAAPRRAAWYHHEEAADGRRWRSLAREGGRHLIRFPRQAVFAVSFEERRITCHPCSGVSADAVRQLFVGHVLPLVFAERGALVLHASAVRLPAGAVAFVGGSRGGKSTLAAALGARGYPLVADDCAIFEFANGGCRVRPMHAGLRLWPDALRSIGCGGSNARSIGGRGKTRVTAASLGIRTCDRPAALHRVYLLDPAPRARSVSIERLPRPEAVVALLTSSFQLDIDRRAHLRQSFEKLSTVAAQVCVSRLRRPRGLTHLPALVDAVLADAVH